MGSISHIVYYVVNYHCAKFGAFYHKVHNSCKILHESAGLSEEFPCYFAVNHNGMAVKSMNQ